MSAMTSDYLLAGAAEQTSVIGSYTPQYAARQCTVDKGSIAKLFGQACAQNIIKTHRINFQINF